MASQHEVKVTNQPYWTNRSRICHPELEGAGFPLVKIEIVACGIADDINIGASVDYASVKVASLNDDFHDRFLGIHARWTHP